MDNLKTVNDFEKALNKVYLSTTKKCDDNRFDIVYSITFHEQVICMLDQLMNILTFNHLNKVVIICSINETIHKELQGIRLPPNIIIHPFIRSPHARMLWNTNLFAAHMNNFELVKNIKFDYFCTLASNEMFIKNIDINIIKKNIVLEKKEFVPSEPIKILDKLNSWVHYKPFMANYYMCSFFVKNNLEPFSLQHEGLVLPKKILYEVLSLYKKDNFNNKTINTQDLLLEEVFIPTYLHNNYNFNDFVLTQRDFDSYSISLKEIEESKLYSVKRVPRDINNNIRCYIRNRYITYLTLCLNVHL